MDSQSNPHDIQVRGLWQMLSTLLIALAAISLSEGWFAALGGMFIAGVLFCRAWVCLSVSAEELHGKEARWDFFKFL